MPTADLAIAATWWHDHKNEVIALAVVVVTFLGARGIDRLMDRRGRALALTMSRGGELTAVVDTRLRYLRRFVVASVIVLGLTVAAAQFTDIGALATSILASGAILAAIVGFAARQSLANVIAGVMLAIAQPLRVGDSITFGADTGTVEDVRLTYTYLRAADGHRIIIPNERLAAGTIHNSTIVDPAVAVRVSLWIPPGADAEAAIEVLRAVAGEDGDVAIAEVTVEGVRLEVTGEVAVASLRAEREAELRRACLRELRSAALLTAAP
jgi:small-conductance mechanosensitive channel